MTPSSSPYGPPVPGEPSGRALVEAMTAQYEEATARAQGYARQLREAATTAADEVLSLTVAPGGELVECTFTPQLASSTPARLGTAFSRLYAAAVRDGARSLAGAFEDYPDIAEHLRGAAPPAEDGPPVATRPAAQDPDAPAPDHSEEQPAGPPPFPPDAALDRWFALFEAHEDPIAGLNAIIEDPEFQAARPGGDPHRWTAELRDELTTMVEQGRALTPELQAVTGTAGNAAVEATVTPTGAVRELRFRPAITSLDPEEAAQQVREALAAARREATAAADAVLHGLASPDFHPWKESDGL